MSRSRKKLISAAERLALPIWVFAMMEASGVRTTAALVAIIEGPRSDSSGTDTRDSLRSLIDQYARAQKFPADPEANSSLVGRIESKLPGTRRYLLSTMWAVLDGDEVAVEDLLASLKTCPALAGCEAITSADGDSGVIADFAALIQRHLENQRSLWRLEALVLLAAYAQKTGDERLAREIASYYQLIEAEIILPPLAEHCRRELSTLCFSLMFKSWLTPTEASTQEGHCQQSSPALWLSGKYPVWATGALCMIMLARLAYAPALPIENPVLFSITAALVTAVTAFPQFGRLTGDRMAFHQDVPPKL